MSDTVERINEALEGRYRIERELGSGGMATVYLAADLKHERQVALKVLRPELAAVMGAERFLAEIKTTANLQHPHILPLFDSGEAGGFLFYVMPYVEGESLREKLDREKQLPVDEAVAIARDVADALQAAHDEGVIHRDIKPANILLSRGRPLVADFGIALAVSAAGGGRLTETGLSMGTPFYMSPEQASADREPTSASDIYSLGCVLYEMLVGEPPYTGGSAQAVLAKILTEDPAPSVSKRPSIPKNVDAAVRKALERLPADRFADLDEFARALADAGFRHGSDSLELSAAGPWKRRAVVATVAAAMFGASTVAALVWGASRAQDLAEPVRSYLMLPSGATVNGASQISFTPDGRTVLVGARTESGLMILRKTLDEVEFVPIPGSQGGEGAAAVSPDSRQVVFRASGGLTAVGLDGGPVTTVVPDAYPLGVEWGADGAVYFPQSYNRGLSRLAEGERVAEEITTPDSLSGELGHWWPQLLPDQEHVLFTAYRSPADSSRIRVVSLRTGEVRTVLEAAFSARYSPSGHLLFALGQTLYGIRFDLDALTTEGQPEVLVDEIAISEANGWGAYGLSTTGTLAYVAAADVRVTSSVVEIDRATGTETVLPIPPGEYESPRLSPNGRTLALSVRRPGTGRDVAIFDLQQPDRPAFVAESASQEFDPLWTSDGSRLVYVCEDVAFDLCWRAPNSSEPERKLWSSSFDKGTGSIVANRLVFDERGTGEARFLSLPLSDSASVPDTLLAFDDDAALYPVLHPDGDWVLYLSGVAGGDGIVLRSLRAGGSLYRLSGPGGAEPRWTRGGREIMYTGGPESPGVFAVSFDPDTGARGQPERLVDAPVRPTNRRYLDVTADGERLILLRRSGEQSTRGRLVMVQNFFTELERLLPN